MPVGIPPGGRRGFKADLLFGGGVPESEFGGVERDGSAATDRGTVFHIAADGESQFRKLDSDLMAAAGFKVDPQEGIGRSLLKGVPMKDGFAGIGSFWGDDFDEVGLLVLDEPGATGSLSLGKTTGDKGQVTFGDCASAELFGES